MSIRLGRSRAASRLPARPGAGGVHGRLRPRVGYGHRFRIAVERRAHGRALDDRAEPGRARPLRSPLRPVAAAAERGGRPSARRGPARPAAGDPRDEGVRSGGTVEQSDNRMFGKLAGPLLVALAALGAVVATIAPNGSGPGVTCDEPYHVLQGQGARNGPAAAGMGLLSPGQHRPQF